MRFDSFEEFFRRATGLPAPYPYQIRIATDESMPQLLSIPTGLGKTAAVILGWLWRRRFAPPEVRAVTPRRLIYCLPMRVLVEQTAACARRWLGALGLVRDSDTEVGEIQVSMLMGGQPDSRWDLHPEKDSVLIGTQDMLLSRALNRGFGMSRFRWPQEFGLLNSDALWLLDEVQLMGSGLATTAQLAAFRKLFGTVGPAHSIWMSATMDRDWLRTVDFAPMVEGLKELTLGPADLDSQAIRNRHEAAKPLARPDLMLEKATAKSYARELAELVLGRHQPASLTLLIVNTVKRAVEAYDALRKRKPAAELLLLHSRFRGMERDQQRLRLEQPLAPEGRIVVSTQVVEAGVDLDARVLISELAPWASMVQRFGRCNRTGLQQAPAALWIDIRDERFALPYDFDELSLTRDLLLRREDVGLSNIVGERLPFHPGSVVRKKDILELFDTTPDLSGADLDVSMYVREASEHDAQVFWRSDLGSSPTHDLPRPQRAELCPVPVNEVKAWLSSSGIAWRWDLLDGEWARVRSSELFPGMTLLLSADRGGYLVDRGWTPTSAVAVDSIGVDHSPPSESMDDDPASQASWLSLDEHTHRVVTRLDEIIQSLPLEPQDKQALQLAAQWHDAGKAHPVFQTTMLGEPPERDSSVCWAKTARRGARHARRGFRHELASGLMLLLNGAPELVAYLAAAHHGRVRLSIRSLPDEPEPRQQNGEIQSDRRFALGIWDGEVLPGTATRYGSVPATSLDLSLMELGDGPHGPSWTARMLRLRDSLGPFRLALLEAILRAADQRGSEVRT